MTSSTTAEFTHLISPLRLVKAIKGDRNDPKDEKQNRNIYSRTSMKIC